MRLPGWLETEATLFGPPVVFEVVPSALQSGGADRAGVLVAGEDAGFLDAQDVDKIAL